MTNTVRVLLCEACFRFNLIGIATQLAALIINCIMKSSSFNLLQNDIIHWFAYFLLQGRRKKFEQKYENIRQILVKRFNLYHTSLINIMESKTRLAHFIHSH